MASAPLPSDEEKALMELQDRMLNGTQTLARLAQQERHALNRKTRTELTLAELEALPADTKTYKSVGKAYFLSTKPEMVTECKELVAACVSEVDSLKAQRTVVETKMKDTESQLRELVQTSPNIVKQLASLRTG